MINMQQMPTTYFGCTLIAYRLVQDYLLLAKCKVFYEVEALVENWIRQSISNPTEEFIDVTMREFLRLLQEEKKK